jgi:hypothetical protein
MGFAANNDQARQALATIRTYGTSLRDIGAIDQSEDFVVDIEYSATPPLESLKGVSGWSYLGFYDSTNVAPYGTIISELDHSKLAGWAPALYRSLVHLWLNSAVIQGSVSKLVVTALHELELHVLAFYQLHKGLMAAKKLNDSGHQQEATHKVTELTAAAQAGNFTATAQHDSAALRANQVLATLMLVCDQAKKLPELDIPPESFEYHVLIDLRHDVLGETNEKLDAIRAHYQDRLPLLSSVYSKNVVDYVVEQFEMD